MKKLATLDWVLIGVFAAVTGVGAYLKLYITPEMPLTLQTMMVILAGLLLGPLRGFLSQVVYILLGLIGLPVFAQGGGGPGYIVQPTFGFILGFLLGAWLSGLTDKALKGWPALPRTFLAGLAGMIGIYGVGLPYLYFIKSIFGHTIAFYGLAVGMIPFGIADLVKIGLAAGIRPALQRALSEE